MSIEAMTWVLKNSEEKLGRRIVLLALANYAHDDGTEAYPSVESLARAARMSERQVQRCLRDLEAAGAISAAEEKSRFGTTIYSVLMPEGDILSPPASDGGDKSGEEGVTNQAESVAKMSPDPSLLQTSEEPSSPPTPTTVDRRPVSVKEGALARLVLASWNGQTGQRLASKDWLSKIIMRIREHPDLDLPAHANAIAASLADPWWSGPPNPSVVYGSGAQFERCLLRLSQGPGDSDRGLSPEEMERFGAAG